MTNPLTGDQALVASAGGWVPRDYRWTRDETDRTLPDTVVDDIIGRLKLDLEARSVIFPEHDALLRRCVTALLVGHLVLQGPPGTGKTTLAQALGRAFRVELISSTATSEWSPFHVVGGLQPDAKGGFAPKLGFVPAAALRCARLARAARESQIEDADPVGAWLLIDEFNRADVDKAIGSLYTLLSSCDPEHMRETPLELWFEQDDLAKTLWVPAMFRIVGTMNDLDTNYVSPISQGLRRRFQFVTVGVPGVGAAVDGSVADELTYAAASAKKWLASTYGLGTPPDEDPQTRAALVTLQKVVDGLRHPSVDGVDGWPLGTAQVVDVLKSYLLIGWNQADSLDTAVADRLVGQMNTLTEPQYREFRRVFTSNQLASAAHELDHLWKPYAVTS